MPVRIQSKKSPVQGTVNFIQHNLPGLQNGEYMMTVTQEVSTQEDSPLANRYFFAVQGPRFKMNPADIYVTFPADQSQGEYNDTLPHIVLKLQTFPWIRYPTVAPPPVAFPDQKYDRDIPTWLGVLLFDGDDRDAYPGLDLTAKSGRLKDLFLKQPSAGSLQGYSYFYDCPDLGSDAAPALLNQHLDYGETSEDACRYIDVPMPLFRKVAPSVDDLKMCAHLRNVDITKKATQNGVPASRNDLSKIPGTSNFAMVVGNRLPQSGKRTFVHLVSLEGLAPFLPIDPAAKDGTEKISYPSVVRINGGGSFPIDSNGFMRLVSLMSWSFTSVGDENQFEQYLVNLKPKNPGGEGAPSTGISADFSIGLPFPEPSDADPPVLKQAKNALAMGYTAMEHHTRAGDRTVSWYRGPLLPYQVKAGRIPDCFPSSDAAAFFNPDSGMFDLSYSGAWQIGRLLSLQNKHFSVALYNWRRSNLRHCVSRMESIVLGQTLDSIQQQLRDDSLIYPLLKTFLPSSSVSLKFAGCGNLTSGRGRHAEMGRTLLSDSGTLANLMKEELEIPFEIYTWLAKLKLLEGVPFRYLVPDEGMLPPESIRFFHLDGNWTQALIDGALSVGRNASKSVPSMESAHDTAVEPDMSLFSDSHARTIRTSALGLVRLSDEKPLENITGFLLRSAAVEGWPGLEINGYASDGSLLDIVRFERLAPTVLLCLFEKDGKTLQDVDIHEPAEGLHFGVTPGTAPSVNLRYNHTEGPMEPGTQVPGVFQAVPFRDSRVIRMFRLSKNLRAKAYETYITGIYPGFEHLPSSEFAMQMIKGVGLVSFHLETGSST